MGTLGKAKHVNCPVNTGFGGLNRIMLIMRRTCGTGEIKDSIDFGIIGKGYIVADKFEIRISDKVGDVSLLSGKEIVQADDIVFILNKPFTEVAAEEARSTGYEGARV
jgi:hypothetical protein